MANVLVEENSLTEIATAIRNKNKETTTYKPNEMANAISNIETGGGGITPEGTKEITENGLYDVTNYASANVNVPTSEPSKLGTKTITENGTYNASSDNLDGYSSVSVNVASSGGSDNFEAEYTGTETNSSYFLKLILKKIPPTSTPRLLSAYQMFYECKNLVEIGYFNTSNVTNMQSMFQYCEKLPSIPLIDTGKATNVSQMFMGCSKLKTIPQLNIGKTTTVENMFYNCKSLLEVPTLNTQNATTMRNFFYSCTELQKIGTYKADKVTDVRNMFTACQNLHTMGGFQNLGSAFLTSRAANYSYYKLDLSPCVSLTHESLMNVINNLYDIATKGCKTQDLVLGSYNLSKLTEDEIAIATTKGWTVS